jgi:hypothetical protein
MGKEKAGWLAVFFFFCPFMFVSRAAGNIGLAEYWVSHTIELTIRRYI